MVDFSAPGVAAQISARVKAEVDAFSASKRTDRFGTRLSPSILGEECAAATWYAWRWVKKPDPKDGRMARYLARGEDEEARIVALLRGTGWTIKDIDPATNTQYAVTDLNGHLYGKLDGLASHPVHTAGVEILFENKLVNYKRFSVLTNIEKPINVSDPKYYGQICLYMELRQLPAAMFVVGNRNDDDIEYRFYLPNPEIAQDLIAKGSSVAQSKVRPARIAESAAFFKCKFCDFAEICHRGAPVEVNCRSCVHCVPVAGGKFYCEHWKAQIPGKDAILAACGNHSPVR